jgi:hypothetical protein
MVRSRGERELPTGLIHLRRDPKKRTNTNVVQEAVEVLLLEEDEKSSGQKVESLFRNNGSGWSERCRTGSARR